jgi:hypothetical protein
MKNLLKIQSELKAPKNQRNNFGKYNYRSCEDILEAVKPLLKKYECILTISDEVKEVGTLQFIEAKATLTDKEQSVTVTSQAGIDINRKGMDVAQSFGSSVSYARKYALNGLFLIDDTKDADATNDHKDDKVKQDMPELKPKTEQWDKVVQAIANGYTIEQVKQKYKISTSNEKILKIETLK